MPSAVIAGKTYNTVIMPDGKEWMAEYLQDDTAGGLWYGNDPLLAYLGRHYNYTELAAFSYPGGWHVPTKAEWDAMAAACGVSVDLAYRLCNSEGWVAGSAIATNAVDTYGLHITPTGTKYSDGWFDSTYYAHIWYGLYDDPTYTYITNISSGGSTVPVYRYVKPIGSGYYAAVRLVRDASLSLSINHRKEWKRPVSIFVPHNGEWTKVSNIFVPHNGDWAPLKRQAIH